MISFIKNLFGSELEIMTWKDSSSKLGYKIILTPKSGSSPFILVSPDKWNRITIPQEIMNIPSFSSVKNRRKQVACWIEKDKKLIIIRFQ